MSNKLRDSKIRINKVECEILKAIDISAKEHPDLTTEEVGSAMLRLLTSMNKDEIKRQSKNL